MNEVGEDWITSRTVLEVTGISRATLNNYIRLGIIPPPLVLSPKENLPGVRKIGYFPREVLTRIERVRELKRRGTYVADIAKLIKGEDTGGRPIREEKSLEGKESERGRAGPRAACTCGGELKVTFEAASNPAYLLDDRFEIIWINRKAEETIFRGTVPFRNAEPAVNIFRVLFRWELHEHIKNWKDLVAYHMAFAKTKHTKPWISRLYQGISGGEIRLLEDLYDRISPLTEEGITSSRISLLLSDGTTEPFRICGIFLREGILHVFRAQHRLVL